VVTKRSTNKPGYWTQKRSELLGPYREALMEGQYVNSDAAALAELRQYSIGLDGEPFHNAENQREAPTGAKKAHADRVVTNHVLVTACSLGHKPKELEGTIAVAAKRRQQVAAVELAGAASRLTFPPFLLSLG